MDFPVQYLEVFSLFFYNTIFIELAAILVKITAPAIVSKLIPVHNKRLRFLSSFRSCCFSSFSRKSELFNCLSFSSSLNCNCCSRSASVVNCCCCAIAESFNSFCISSACLCSVSRSSSRLLSLCWEFKRAISFSFFLFHIFSSSKASSLLVRSASFVFSSNNWLAVSNASVVFLFLFAAYKYIGD